MPKSLQEGLFRLCREKIAQDASFQHSGKNDVGTQADGKLFYEYQWHRMKQTIEYVYANSKFYKNLFDKNHITPETIQNWEDIKKIPFTNPQDITGNNYEFLCISQAKVEKPVTVYSSGTTGIKKRLFFSQNDIYSILQFLSVGMNTVADENETIQIILPDANQQGIGTLLRRALEANKMYAYTTDMMDSSESQIERTMQNKPAVWFGDAGTIYRITKEMEKKADLKTLGVKVLFLTMSPSSNAAIDYLEKTWNCRVCTHYGLTEMGWGMAVDCACKRKYHYNELNVYAEVIDPLTGKNVPDGAEGELVFTSLGREAMPLLRYRSHDYGSITRKPCCCGSLLQSLSYVRKREESIIRLNEKAEIYPVMLEEVLYSFDAVVDYQAFIERKGDKPKLVFKIEVLENREGLATNIAQAVYMIPEIAENMQRPHVELLEAGALKALCYEKKLIRETE